MVPGEAQFEKEVGLPSSMTVIAKDDHLTAGAWAACAWVQSVSLLMYISLLVFLKFFTYFAYFLILKVLNNLNNFKCVLFIKVSGQITSNTLWK